VNTVFKNQPEAIIACAVKNTQGYIFVGSNHGHAAGNLGDRNYVYTRTEGSSKAGTGIKRMMMTESGRLVSIEEAWKMGEELGIVTKTLSCLLDSIRLRPHLQNASEKELIMQVTSLDFKECGFSFNVEKAEIFARLHNDTCSTKYLGEIKKPTIEERFFLTKGRGD